MVPSVAARGKLYAVGRIHTKRERARSEKHKPTDMILPSTGTPWSELVSVLLGRAQAGDKAASDRLFKVTYECERYTSAVRVARSLLHAKANVDNLSVAQLTRDLGSYESLQSILRDNEAACSEVTRDELFAKVYPILHAAGRNGNEAAAACYASGPYDAFSVGKSVDNASALALWATNALEFMHAGLKKGDWKMVYLLQSYTDPVTRTFATSHNSMWQVYQFQPNPRFSFRYAQLWAIGARADGSNKDKARADGILLELEQANQFSSDQVRHAEQWAQQTYRRYFAGKPWTLGGDTLTLCDPGTLQETKRVTY